MDKLQTIKEIIPTLKFKFPYEQDDYAQNLYFENYHCHKDFSNSIVADSGELIESYAKRCNELKAKCLFSGEHGTQGNYFHTYNVAEANKLKYRHSSEVYWVKDRHDTDKTNCHMVMVAKNNEGKGDINFALSMANIDGYYYRPRIDLELLNNIPKDNIIITSQCIAGWGYENAEDIWLRIHDRFGDNFFFELQANNVYGQKKLNEKILRLADRYGIQIIAGLDSHYINDIGKVKRDQILKYKGIEYPEEEGWYMDYPDAMTLFNRFKEQNVLSEKQIFRSIMNTNVFVNECEEITFDKSFKIPTLYLDKTYDERVKIYKSELNKAYKNEKLKSKEKADGIKWEANQVIESGTVDYFLTTQKIIEEAVNNFGGVLTTTSRGSAASFVSNKLLGITTVDRYNAEIPIYPERFITKERILAGSMPDCDLNVAEQEPFIKASRKLLGEYSCYPLMAVEKLKPKNAWKLYAGANDVPIDDANQVSKYIDEYEDAMKHTADEDKENIRVEDFIPVEYQNLFKASNDYRGITINNKVHACGNLLLNGDIRREIGLISAVSETTGKRTLCACVEGKFLDDFGYVKEDFLIVDSVGLTYEFFKSIGKSVPSFEELKELVMNDDKTWEIYEKGITCCVNQCEREKTIQKVMKYKPKSIGELSSFIAGIRPGFSSLLDVFLNRDEYSTGEKTIDDLLSDTSHFMIYQESIMKVLGYLGKEMGETYKIIKNISKKKYLAHPEKLKELKEELITEWKRKVGSVDNFENVWKVIESSAAYAFNAPHQYSMQGDSLYQAYFKAHHTKEFYEVAISHYQQKNDKDKIAALTKEAVKFFGYKIGNYKYGKDNRTVNIDDVNKVIYPNLSSVKGFGEGTVQQIYESGQENLSSFVDVITDMIKRRVNKTLINKLIRLNFFDMYGDINKLLDIMSYYDILYEAKSISKDKAYRYNIPLNILKKHSKETEKMFSKVDSESVLNEMIAQIKYRPLTMKEILDNEHEILDMNQYVDQTASKSLYYVTFVEKLKSIVNIKLYEIHSGKTREVKMWTTSYERQPFNEMDLLMVYSIDPEFKKEWNGEYNESGKKVYIDTDKKEFWLKSYKKY